MIEAGTVLAWIQKIQNPKLQRLVEAIMVKYYAKLRELPSSISGKHHPPDERGPLGLVRHICRCAKLCEEFAREFNLPQREKDWLIAAALLHDIANCDIIQWNGKEWIRDEVEQSLHPMLSSIILRRLYCPPELQDDVEAIARLIERHMSHWNYPASPKPETVLEYLFCAADDIVTKFEMKEVPE